MSTHTPTDSALPDGFIAWNGPVGFHDYFPPGISDETQVETIFRNGQKHTGCGQSFGWNHTGYFPRSPYHRLSNPAG